MGNKIQCTDCNKIVDLDHNTVHLLRKHKIEDEMFHFELVKKEDEPKEVIKTNDISNLNIEIVDEEDEEPKPVTKKIQLKKKEVKSRTE